MQANMMIPENSFTCSQNMSFPGGFQGGRSAPIRPANAAIASSCAQAGR